VLFSLKKRALFFFRFLKDCCGTYYKGSLSIVCALSKEKSLSSFARKTVVERNTKDLSPLCVLFSLKKRSLLLSLERLCGTYNTKDHHLAERERERERENDA
tara:strand:+ start:3798 stop:4103 length:306 start_codon:yes stop_codon:yes gene_type:complete